MLGDADFPLPTNASHLRETRRRKPLYPNTVPLGKVVSADYEIRRAYDQRPDKVRTFIIADPNSRITCSSFETLYQANPDTVMGFCKTNRCTMPDGIGTIASYTPHYCPFPTDHSSDLNG